MREGNSSSSFVYCPIQVFDFFSQSVHRNNLKKEKKIKKKGSKFFVFFSLKNNPKLSFVGGIKIEALTPKGVFRLISKQGFVKKEKKNRIGKVKNSHLICSTMSKISVSLDKWRDYFSSADSDIFSIIEHAIMVAASDCPYDFKEKRDRIAELLFTCHRAELSVENGGGGGGGGEYKNGGGSKDSKESKVISHSGDDDDDDHTEDDVETNVENRFDDAEALTDEIEEESQLLEEVARIRGILDEREEKVCFFFFIWFSFLFDLTMNLWCIEAVFLMLRFMSLLHLLVMFCCINLT